MHAGVTELTFSHGNIHTEPEVNHIIRDFSSRMPNLTWVEFHTQESVRHKEDGLCSFIKNLQHIKLVRLPAYFLTRRVVEVLGSRPRLRCFTLGYGHQEDTYPPQPSVSFRPLISPTLFPALKQCSLHMHIPDAIKVLFETISPAHLEILIVMLVQTGLSADFATFFQVCAQKHKSVTHLRLYGLNSSGVRRELSDSVGDALRGVHMKPLADFTMLVRLDIYHPLPLVLSVVDVDAIVSSLPHLQNLSLNP